MDSLAISLVTSGRFDRLFGSKGYDFDSQRLEQLPKISDIFLLFSARENDNSGLIRADSRHQPCRSLSNRPQEQFPFLFFP